MSRSRSAMIVFSMLLLFLVGCVAETDMGTENDLGQAAQTSAADQALPSAERLVLVHKAEESPPATPSGLQVRLSSGQTTASWDDRDPARARFELPLLYLHRQLQTTEAAERTLDLQLWDIDGSVEIQVEAVSRHEHPYLLEPHKVSKAFMLPDRSCTAGNPCTLRWTLDPSAFHSDLYYLCVKNSLGELLWSNPIPERPDFAILYLWDVPLGAYTVRVYYATLFPFARDPDRMDYRMPPDAVPGFIEHQFVPIIQDTWQTQLQEWGFGDPIHADWDVDKMVEIIITAPPFALFDGTGTYTVFTDETRYPYPQRRIWWYSTHPAFQRYDSWENAHRAILAHEFFHMAQWNVLLHTGRPGNFWLNTFIESQAEFAVGVQYPELEMQASHVLTGNSAYGHSANRFLAYQLNTSYRQLELDAAHKYDLALYWRFLYEQYGDMGIIRAALEEMASGRDAEIVIGFPLVMDRALQRINGPFHSFEESLVAFARASYALRLGGGRCVEDHLDQCDGLLFDPDQRYVRPPVEAELNAGLGLLTYDGAVPSSYGMDFVEIGLDPILEGQPLTVRIQGTGDVTRFGVQIWRLKRGENGLRAATPYPDSAGQGPVGTYDYHIPAVDTAAYDSLALIITRLDSDEGLDPEGQYRITLGSAAKSTDHGGE